MKFPRGIAQGETATLFVVGEDGRDQIVNARVLDKASIADRLFGATELRLGGQNQTTVRITRRRPT